MKGSDTKSALYLGIKKKPHWQDFPLRFDHLNNLYIDSLEKVGENMHRFRDKSKEVVFFFFFILLNNKKV